jgi:hypothetical protein
VVFTLNAGKYFAIISFFLNRKVRKDFRKVHNDCKVFLIDFKANSFIIIRLRFLTFEPMKGLKLFWVLWRVVLYFNGHSHIGDVPFCCLY